MTNTKTKRNPLGLRLQTQNQSIILLMLMLLLMMISVTAGLVSCSGQTDYDDDESTSTELTNQKKRDQTSPARTSTRTSLKSSPRQSIPGTGMIKKVYYASRIARAGSKMKIKVETTEPLKENQYLSFIWWRNGKKLEETQEATLPISSFKKGDVIFTDVLLYQDNQLIERKRTEMVQIVNSRPVIKEVIFPQVKGPGTYTLKVKAEDPDGDPLTFSIEKEALPVDVQINPSTGVVTCILDENTPEILKFIIGVDDGSGVKTKKVVTMNFFKQSVKE
jgi:hypothetical protein